MPDSFTHVTSDPTSSGPATSRQAGVERTSELTPSGRLALVTGATGYVGGEVVAELVRRGCRVRLLSRSADKVKALPWWSDTQCEVIEGDASNADDVARALRDIDVAWYLLHSMNNSADFEQEEKAMAQIFADAARDAGVSRIVYLGGLHPQGEKLSAHLASRVTVGEVLMNSGVPTAALQAGVVIGDGSSSFQMLRNLAERLPGAIAPKWVRNRIQPIAVADAVHYLVAAADLAADVNRTFDIGGPEALEYADMMKEYAAALGLWPRLVATAPVTTPGLAARWIGLVTPVSSRLATPLIGSLQHDTVVHERDLDALVGAPEGGHTPFRDAARAAACTQDVGRWRRTLAMTSAGVVATGLLGILATDSASAWYRTLRKPAFQPPAWLFPVAWTALYADIALVGALSLADLGEKEQPRQQRAYAVALAGNLALNAGWSVLFFDRKKVRWALAESVLLAASSADLARRSAQVSPEKGAALAPYAAWTGFAAVLAGAIVHLNPRRR